MNSQLYIVRLIKHEKFIEIENLELYDIFVCIIVLIYSWFYIISFIGF